MITPLDWQKKNPSIFLLVYLFWPVSHGVLHNTIVLLVCRSPSKRYARRTVGATTRDVIMTERSAIDGYTNTPHSNSLDNFPTNPWGGGSRGASPQKGYPGGNHIPNSNSYPLAFPTNTQTNTTGNGSAVGYNPSTLSSPSSPTNQQSAYENSKTESPVSSPSSPVNHSSSSSSSPQKHHNSFLHSSVRSTLPNDYKPTSYTVKGGGVNGGWGVVGGGSAATSRTVTPQPHPLHALNSSDSSRLSRSFDSRSLDRKEGRKAGRGGVGTGVSGGAGVSGGGGYENVSNTDYRISTQTIDSSRGGGSNTGGGGGSNTGTLTSISSSATAASTSPRKPLTNGNGGKRGENDE